MAAIIITLLNSHIFRPKRVLLSQKITILVIALRVFGVAICVISFYSISYETND
jgi:hypothetical protein